MDDFKASSPEQRGPANPNVEYIPFEEMKKRILKIVDGYSGIPFTIQRLCELLTDPKRNYTGTDKFLRGVEKNVMVVSCVYPSSEKNGSSCMNRMNGVMFPGNASAFSDRNVNGPGTPRPVNRPKLSLSNSVATNGLPDSTENKDQDLELTERTVGDPVSSEQMSLSGAPSKSKLREEEDEAEEEEEVRHDAKRLKFNKDDEDREEGEAQGEDEGKGQPCVSPVESSSDAPRTPPGDAPEPKDTPTACADEQEPSSTQSESVCDGDNKSGMEGSPGPAQSQDSGCELDQSEQHDEPAGEEPVEMQDAEEKLDPVSSSSSEEAAAGPEPAPASPSSSTEPAAEGSSSAENSSDSSETADDTMEQE